MARGSKKKSSKKNGVHSNLDTKHIITERLTKAPLKENGVYFVAKDITKRRTYRCLRQVSHWPTKHATVGNFENHGPQTHACDIIRYRL